MERHEQPFDSTSSCRRRNSTTGIPPNEEIHGSTHRMLPRPTIPTEGTNHVAPTYLSHSRLTDGNLVQQPSMGNAVYTVATAAAVTAPPGNREPPPGKQENESRATKNASEAKDEKKPSRPESIQKVIKETKSPVTKQQSQSTSSAPGKSSFQVEISIMKGKRCGEKTPQSIGMKPVMMSVEGIMRRLLRQKLKNEAEVVRASALESKRDRPDKNALRDGYEVGTKLESLKIKTALTTEQCLAADSEPHSPFYSPEDKVDDDRKDHDVDVCVSYDGDRGETALSAQVAEAASANITATSLHKTRDMSPEEVEKIREQQIKHPMSATLLGGMSIEKRENLQPTLFAATSEENQLRRRAFAEKEEPSRVETSLRPVSAPLDKEERVGDALKKSESKAEPQEPSKIEPSKVQREPPKQPAVATSGKPTKSAERVAVARAFSWRSPRRQSVPVQRIAWKTEIRAHGIVWRTPGAPVQELVWRTPEVVAQGVVWSTDMIHNERELKAAVAQLDISEAGSAMEPEKEGEGGRGDEGEKKDVGLQTAVEDIYVAEAETLEAQKITEKHVQDDDVGAMAFICGLLLCLLLILIVIVIFLLLHFKVFSEDRTTPPGFPGGNTTDGSGLTIYYCTTTFCNSEGQYLKSLLSKDKQPCDNFYDHVCDLWAKSHPHDDSKVGSVISTDTLLRNAIEDHVTPFILNATDPDVRVATDLYQQCLDRSKADMAIASAREIFRLWVIGDWPRTGASSTMNEVWTFAGELIRDLDVSGILRVKAGVNPNTLQSAIIELAEPQLLYLRGQESEPPLVTLFRGAVKEVATGFGVDASLQDDLADDVMNVFEKIAYAVEDINIQGSNSGPPTLTVYNLDGGMQSLLKIVFDNVYQVGLTTPVVVKSPNYVYFGLPNVLRDLPPGPILNYLGFLALIRMTPFFPERLRDLRQLFSKSVIGRASGDVTDSASLCLRLIDKLLPSCFTKAYSQYMSYIGAAAIIRQWMSQIETTFGDHISKLHWIDELSALFVRYRMKLWQLVRYSPPSGACSPNYRTRASSPLHAFHEVSILRQQQEIQSILRQGDSRTWRLPQSVFSVRATYDPSRQVVYTPQGLVNTSVPPSSTLFAFHLARIAVRTYRALADVLLNDNVYVGETKLAFSEESRRILGELLGCFERDVRYLPRNLGPGFLQMNPLSTKRAALLQTLAVHLGFRAFRELIHARRIWNLDFRLGPLPKVSADQLFFIYYALDNCESAERVYQSTVARSDLPAQYMVNLPLRHLPEFKKLFGCTSTMGMAVPRVATCEVGTPLQVWKP